MKEELKELARKLFRHYRGKMMADAPFINAQLGRDKLDTEPKKVQTLFLKAAQSCSGVGAKPRDWIESQFDKFEDYTKFIGKRIVPQPTQLFGMNAVARYVQWMSDQEGDAARERSKQKLVVRGEYTIEERNLKALMRSLRMPEIDVLCERPEDFSKSFLKAKGVYEAVREKREENLS